MGMPVTIEIVDMVFDKKILNAVFSYFKYIDGKFSTYKKNSDISKINRGELSEQDYSRDLKEIFLLSEKTKRESNGYFDIYYKGKCDPSGLVKGWAIRNAGKLIESAGFSNFYVEAGRDVEICGKNRGGKKWNVGIKNPFDDREIVKVLYLSNCGIATSGTYTRGEHIYNPKGGKVEDGIVSLTVVGPNVYEADRWATAGFAMGRKGIDFLEKLNYIEAYMIDKDGIATMTSGFEKYTIDA